MTTVTNQVVKLSNTSMFIHPPLLKLDHHQQSSILLKTSRVYCSKCRDQTGSFQRQHEHTIFFTHGCTRKFTINYSFFLSVSHMFHEFWWPCHCAVVSRSRSLYHKLLLRLFGKSACSELRVNEDGYHVSLLPPSVATSPIHTQCLVCFYLFSLHQQEQ